MAQYGEWNRKGATLSDVTATKEYGVDRDFITKGIHAGKLEYREGSVWGSPYLRILRRQLEAYIVEELGQELLSRSKDLAELRKIKKAISTQKKTLAVLQSRRAELEKSVANKRTAKGK